MGMIIAPHEIYFGTFLSRFNDRFGPSAPGQRSVWNSGGIVEIAALQKEFEIFRKGRPFRDSAAVLGLTGHFGGPAKDRWLEYLAKLPDMDSDKEGVKGDPRIVDALIDNLERDNPLPCYMQAYDGRTREPGLVIITEESPVFFLESVTFLTISLPMRPEAPKRSARPRTGGRTSRSRTRR